MIEAIVLALRLAATALAIYNVSWTWRGALALLRGSTRPPELYLATVFWFAVSILVFQGGYFANGPSRPSDLWRLVAYICLAGGMLLAALGHRLGSLLKARQFYLIYDHLNVGLAIVELEQIDPDAAANIATECRRLTAAHLATRSLNA